MSEAAPAATAIPEAQEARPADAGTNESLLWALGGGALLLVGLGGAALVRRRRTGEEAQDAVLTPSPAPLVEKPAPAAPAFVEREPVVEAPVARAPIAAAPLGAGVAHGSNLAAMVAAPPSAENPFRTHRKRLARARYLLAQQERRDHAPHRDEPAAVPPQTTHAEPQTQTVYRMGGDRNRRMTFKPQTR